MVIITRLLFTCGTKSVLRSYIGRITKSITSVIEHNVPITIMLSAITTGPAVTGDTIIVTVDPIISFETNIIVLDIPRKKEVPNFNNVFFIAVLQKRNNGLTYYIICSAHNNLLCDFCI